MKRSWERFVSEYLVDLNGTGAAIRAGYSARSARVLANRMMKDPRVREAVDKAMAARAAVTEVTAERVIEMLLASYKSATEAEQFGSAIRAAELLGKHVGMFIERHEHAGKDGKPIEVNLENALERLFASVTSYASRIGAEGGPKLLN